MGGKKMKGFCALLILGTLVACGGGGSSPTTPATPVPTPTPVTYNGTYTGTSMTFTSSEGKMYISAHTTITHTGSTLRFGDLVMTAPIQGSFGLGPAALTGNNFDGTNRYESAGCGTMNNHYRGWFSGDGNAMNMTMTLTSTDCGEIDIRGEMLR
jgi:ABC-type glycerol-3-phosphate transport system substrate-binding protein